MSSSVPIPSRPTVKTTSSLCGGGSWGSSTASSCSSSLASPSTLPTVNGTRSIGKGKAPAVPPLPSSPTNAASEADRISPRRPSLMGSSLSQSEHIVINLAREEGPPRLVTCVKSSQGFDWNHELFLPSYAHAECDAQEMEHRPDPIQEIVLTDEEAESLLPK